MDGYSLTLIIKTLFVQYRFRSYILSEIFTIILDMEGDSNLGVNLSNVLLLLYQCTVPQAFMLSKTQPSTNNFKVSLVLNFV